MTTNETKIIEPHPNLVWPYLAWTFGWSWGFWLLCIFLKSLWPGNPPMPYLALEGLIFTLGMFGPMVASLIVLKKRNFKAITTFLFSGRRGTWLYFLIFVGALAATAALAAGGRLVEGALATLPLHFIQQTTLAGGVEEAGWRGFLQPALEKKFAFPLATVIVGTVWAIWHIPFLFYKRFMDWGSPDSFPSFLVLTIIVAFWYAALYKKTRSVIACNFFHALLNTVISGFVGISEAERFGDLSKINPFFYLGGIALLTLYSIYLWYRTDKEEKAREAGTF